MNFEINSKLITEILRNNEIVHPKTQKYFKVKSQLYNNIKRSFRGSHLKLTAGLIRYAIRKTDSNLKILLPEVFNGITYKSKSNLYLSNKNETNYFSVYKKGAMPNQRPIFRSKYQHIEEFLKQKYGPEYINYDKYKQNIKDNFKLNAPVQNSNVDIAVKKVVEPPVAPPSIPPVNEQQPGDNNVGGAGGAGIPNNAGRSVNLGGAGGAA